MDRNRKWVPGSGAVLLILLSHLTSALEVPLDRKYCPHQYHIRYDYQSSELIVWHIVGHNEEHYSLQGVAADLSSSLLVFMCLSFACVSMVFSSDMQFNF